MSDDKLLSHDYDGIQELDNDLPRWWLWLFIISVVWAVLYVFYYHVASIGYLSEDEYKLEMNPSYVRSSSTQLLGVLPEYHSPLHNPYGDVTPYSQLMGIETEAFVRVTRETDTLVYAEMTEEADLVAGHEVFIKNCANCHGNLGEGGVGPNLTDDYWIHGATMTDVTKTVLYGFPAKGMISWRGFLNDKQILQAASHILTLKGTNPPNGKAPQGDLVTD